MLVIRIGGFEMGNEVFLVVVSAIIPCISIVSNTIIAAEATVIENINNAGVYVGTPARRVSG